MTARARKLAALYAATTVAIALIAIDPAWFYIAAGIAALVTVAVLTTQRDEARIENAGYARFTAALEAENVQLHLELTEAQGRAADAEHWDPPLRLLPPPSSEVSDYDWPRIVRAIDWETGA